MSLYELKFTASNPEPLPVDAWERVFDALVRFPGVEPGEWTQHDHDPQTVTAGFVIAVEQAMGEAALHGTRLAKDSLTMAGMPDAKLVDLSVRLVRDEGD
jgi:hypothetical protein